MEMRYPGDAQVIRPNESTNGTGVPGGPGVKNPPANAEGLGSIPG